MTDSVYADTLELCYTKFNEIIVDDDFTLPTITKFVVVAMEIVESTDVKNIDKKKIVIEILRRFIEKSKSKTEVKFYATTLLDSGLIESIIESLVKATKHEIQVNNTPKPSACCTFINLLGIL